MVSRLQRIRAAVEERGLDHSKPYTEEELTRTPLLKEKKEQTNEEKVEERTFFRSEVEIPQEESPAEQLQVLPDTRKKKKKLA